jgi:hypothetical protein
VSASRSEALGKGAEVTSLEGSLGARAGPCSGTERPGQGGSSTSRSGPLVTGGIRRLGHAEGTTSRPARRGDPLGEQGEAHALLVKAVSGSEWQAARQALDELLRKLLVVHRLLGAEERLAKREPPTEPT